MNPVPRLELRAARRSALSSISFFLRLPFAHLNCSARLTDKIRNNMVLLVVVVTPQATWKRLQAGQGKAKKLKAAALGIRQEED